MKIANNIIKHHLSHVYWVVGTACAGKTTLCKYLSEKYHMYYYDSDTKFGEHLLMSNAKDQPAMNIDRSDWNIYFSRPPKEYAKWLRDSITEQYYFIIADLLSLPKDKLVIVDNMFSPEITSSISPYNHVLCLTSESDIANREFFDRDDKNDLYQLIMSLNNAKSLFDNVSKTLKLVHSETYDKIINSNLAYYIRSENTTLDDLVKYAVNHFKL